MAKRGLSPACLACPCAAWPVLFCPCLLNGRTNLILFKSRCGHQATWLKRPLKARLVCLPLLHWNTPPPALAAAARCSVAHCAASRTLSVSCAALRCAAIAVFRCPHDAHSSRSSRLSCPLSPSLTRLLTLPFSFSQRVCVPRPNECLEYLFYLRERSCQSNSVCSLQTCPCQQQSTPPLLPACSSPASASDNKHSGLWAQLLVHVCSSPVQSIESGILAGYTARRQNEGRSGSATSFTGYHVVSALPLSSQRTLLHARLIFTGYH